MRRIICYSFTGIIQKYIEHIRSLDLSIKHKFISNDIQDEKLIGFSCCDEHYVIEVSDIIKRKCALQDSAINTKCGLFDNRIISNKRRIEVANIISHRIKNSLKDLDDHIDLVNHEKL